jgi:acetate kinase
MFIDSILHYIGAYAVEMGGLDNLVFTGGIGENSEYVREKVCEKLAFLGVSLDENANRLPNTEGIRIISDVSSSVRVMIIPADEEIVVGRKSYRYYLEQKG